MESCDEQRPDYAPRGSGIRWRGPATHVRPDHDAVAGWLSGLGQLRAPAALDRTILDRVHQDVSRSPRSQPVLVLVVTLGCVVFGATVKFHPRETASGVQLAKSPDVAPPVRSAAVRISTAPGQPSAQPGDIVSPALLHAADVPTPTSVVRPRDTYRANAKSTLALRGSVPSRRHQVMPAGDAVPPLRMASVTIAQPAAAAAAALLPAVTERSADMPPGPRANPLSWSGAGLAAAPIQLHERLNGLVSPNGLLAAMPRDNPRPIYKRAWFIGMLGVAATGLAAGVTAAVVTSQPASRSASVQPLGILLGPT